MNKKRRKRLDTSREVFNLSPEMFGEISVRMGVPNISITLVRVDLESGSFILRRGFEEYGRNLPEFTPVEIEPLRACSGFASSVGEAGSPSPLGGG